MARDIAGRFNDYFGEDFVLPEAEFDESGAAHRGLDGRKMSKSYNNTIPLFLSEKQFRKQINKIKTNLLEPGEPKDPDTSTVFQIWQAFATEQQAADMRQAFADGIAWGEAKKMLSDLVLSQLGDARERYNDLMENTSEVESILKEGAEKARVISRPFLSKLRDAVGIRAL